MDAQKLANHAEGLFSLPEVSNRLATLLEDESFALPEIAELISYDPVLLGRLLTTANQAPYQGPVVDNVSEAVARIGLKDLRTLVISTKAVQTFSDLPPDLVDMNNFWHHSVCTGLAAESLAFKCGATEPTQLFVGGLTKNALVGISPKPSAATVTMQSHCHDTISSFLSFSNFVKSST